MEALPFLASQPLNVTANRVLRCPDPCCSTKFLGKHSKGNLSRHLKFVHRIGRVNEADLKCGNCGKKFSRTDAITVHARRVHNLADRVKS